MSSTEPLEHQLRERLRRPQRHRLLQGFPAVPAMQVAAPPGRRRLLDGRVVAGTRRDEPEPGDRGETQAAVVDIDRSRGLIVGVIPHTQCIPRVEGCGFCTFAHDPANKHTRVAMIERVVDDIARVASDPGIVGRAVDAIYLGGGTANLASSDDVAGIVRTLAQHVSIADAELTLEGVPQLFTTWFGEPIKRLAQLPTSTKRVSMGVQTFDAAMLARMGREKLGDRRTVQRVIKQARAVDVATSGDFLFNLPGQTAQQMDDDVDIALDLGLDQICLYNLVLYEGLGTPWASDPALVTAMPDNDVACANWLRLRERLLAAGYVQTTVTNFERADVVSGPHRFRYEVDSFSPERFDGVGMGPMSISTVVDWRSRTGHKLVRRKNMVGVPWSKDDLSFVYDDVTLRGLFVVRSLAKTRFSLSTYASLFGSSFSADFATAIAVLVDAGLIVVDADHGGGAQRGSLDDEGALPPSHRVCALTPKGMFFSDAVVAVLTSSLARSPSSGAGVHTADLLAERPRTADYLSMG